MLQELSELLVKSNRLAKSLSQIQESLDFTETYLFYLSCGRPDIRPRCPDAKAEPYDDGVLIQLWQQCPTRTLYIDSIKELHQQRIDLLDAILAERSKVWMRFRGLLFAVQSKGYVNKMRKPC